MTIREWRHQRASRRADRLALRAEQSRGDGWLEFQRRRRADKRALRAARRAEGIGTSPDIQPDKAWGQTYGSGGYYSKNQPPRP
jgi:hypothetical protein